MKLVEMKCKNCGAKLKVDSLIKEANCQFCGAEFKIDDEVQHHKLDNAEQIGYELEMGKIRAREEAKQRKIQEKNAELQAKVEDEKRKKNIIWWIVGWIFFFPIPLTILIWKSKWDKKKKITMTIVMWCFIFIIGAFSPSETTSNQVNDISSTGYVKEKLNVNETFIKKYNSIGTSKIENTTTYDAQDKESGYYRTEFRLSAFKNNSSVHGTINNSSIDIINFGSMDEKNSFRFYASVETENQMKEIFKNVIMILDKDIKEEEIDKIIKDAISLKDRRLVLNGNIKTGYIIYQNSKWEIFIESNIEFAK